MVKLLKIGQSHFILIKYNWMNDPAAFCRMEYFPNMFNSKNFEDF